jgi:hypothetical protein
MRLRWRLFRLASWATRPLGVVAPGLARKVETRLLSLTLRESAKALAARIETLAAAFRDLNETLRRAAA